MGNVIKEVVNGGNMFILHYQTLRFQKGLGKDMKVNSDKG